ncbi:MAG: LacI family transcriptional regulator [Chloroflexi bacterium]|nr:LacI family transcriptional regulator [Chloroflexota bacterium]MCL5109506.1 LacI family transcriptional regulator [Chloroflexota bacterium]
MTARRASGATLKDVAREAGVSVTSAFRALNNRGELREESRGRIREVAERLHYVPSEPARAMVRGSTKTIGFLTNMRAPLGWSVVLAAMEAVFEPRGYDVLVASSDEEPEREARRLLTMVRKRVDGVLLLPTGNNLQQIVSLRERGIALVLLYYQVAGLDADCVTFDFQGGARRMVSYLVELGHRRIGYAASYRRPAEVAPHELGYREALEEAGLAVDEDLVVRATSHTSIQAGYDQGERLLNRPDRPSAVFAANDLQAIGVMEACRQLGLRVPKDVSVVGLGDMEFSRYLQVPLTTMSQDRYQAGVKAAELLLARTADRMDAATQVVVLEPRLIVRESAAPPG